MRIKSTRQCITLYSEVAVVYVQRYHRLPIHFFNNEYRSYHGCNSIIATRHHACMDCVWYICRVFVIEKRLRSSQYLTPTLWTLARCFYHWATVALALASQWKQRCYRTIPNGVLRAPAKCSCWKTLQWLQQHSILTCRVTPTREPCSWILCSNANKELQ